MNVSVREGVTCAAGVEALILRDYIIGRSPDKKS